MKFFIVLPLLLGTALAVPILRGNTDIEVLQHGGDDTDISTLRDDYRDLTTTSGGNVAIKAIPNKHKARALFGFKQPTNHAYDIGPGGTITPPHTPPPETTGGGGPHGPPPGKPVAADNRIESLKRRGIPHDLTGHTQLAEENSTGLTAIAKNNPSMKSRRSKLESRALFFSSRNPVNHYGQGSHYGPGGPTPPQTPPPVVVHPPPSN